MNKNGWSVIERLLDKKEKNQSWLAKKLNMTPAAVSQIKYGLFKLNQRYIEKILTVLEATDLDRLELYSEIINARFFSNTKMEAKVVKK